MLGRVLTVLAVTALVVTLAGCRTPKPNAPKHEVDQLLSQLGLYCGEATELRVFGAGDSRLARLDSEASDVAHRLVRIMRANPDASYLGQSMRQVVGGSIPETQECGLRRTSSELSGALSGSR